MSGFDVIIIGAGAAGLMCAIEAAKRGRSVLILEKSNKVGKKILMSGGGRCNFTNIHTSPEQFISNNAHFCKSALSRYTQWDFINLVEKHSIAYFEKTLGQLFCEDKSALIVEMLLKECADLRVAIHLNQSISQVNKGENGFVVQVNHISHHCESLVVASGGLSIPTLGSSPFGYQLAAQFGLKVYPLRAGLVPFTLHLQDKARFESLAGISIEALVSCRGKSFREQLLFTHRGLSGPVMLQISSYWYPGDRLSIRFLPTVDLHQALLLARGQSPNVGLKTFLSSFAAKRLLDVLYTPEQLVMPLKQFTDKAFLTVANQLQDFSITPNATEGYRTAEVTLGGVDCNEICSKRFEAKQVPGLFFVGEVLDVTGWLGGYNFQWAWSSGWAAGQVV
ncbi:MAG: NAD(P)/FAD-dependent oxidoreductase [Legionella sp.]|nr:NAD(P)/FAD-dependent oxidoreductase [Legionella sp.]